MAITTLPSNVLEMRDVYYEFYNTQLNTVLNNPENAFQSIEMELFKLKEQLLEEERTFYKTIGFEEGSLQKNYMKFQSDLDLFNKSYEFCLNGTAAFEQIQKQIFDDDYWLKRIENAIQEYSTSEQFAQEIESFIGTGMENTLGDFLSHINVNYNQGKKISRNANVYKASLIQDGVNWKIIIDTDNGYVNPKPIYEKIAQVLHVGGPKGDSKARVIPILKNFIPHDKLRPFFIAEIENNLDKYDLFPNLSSLKGFLLEVRNNAFLNYLGQTYGNGLVSRAVGAAVRNNKGQEIPVDIIFAGTQFQVKNWYFNPEEGMIRVPKQNNKSLIDLLQKIEPNVNILDAYSAFFGMANFNLPIQDRGEIYELLGGKESFAKYLNMRSGVDKKYESIINQLPTYFKYSLDKILQITGHVALKDPIEGLEDNFMNTFFLINGKIVPSSAIVEGILRSLEVKSDSTEIIKFTSLSVSTKTGSKYEDYLYKTSSHGGTKGTVRKKAMPSIVTAARRTKVTYEITINLNEVIQIALNSV